MKNTIISSPYNYISPLVANSLSKIALNQTYNQISLPLFVTMTKETISNTQDYQYIII